MRRNDARNLLDSSEGQRTVTEPVAGLTFTRSVADTAGGDKSGSGAEAPPMRRVVLIRRPYFLIYDTDEMPMPTNEAVRSLNMHGRHRGAATTKPESEVDGVHRVRGGFNAVSEGPPKAHPTT
ncbi:hypothetical protein LshimejAT787_1403150 [Lyophyllum shimeji]|uniref:Uncharacterized protein n=1 Tax=Lyophyllum shimeji TaxID=47721 RepID=A0A9P3PYA3_LYOSH|nr:hypothetical protein LshimejAT787_1403150 [Lyophyllum shimeji]